MLKPIVFHSIVVLPAIAVLTIFLHENIFLLSPNSDHFMQKIFFPEIREYKNLGDNMKEKKIRTDKNKLIIYILGIYAVAYAIQILIWITGGIGTNAFGYLAPLAMFLPGLGALIYLRISGEGWRFINWRLGKPLYLIIAVLVPAITALVCVGILTTLGLAKSPHLGLANGYVVISQGLFVLGKGEQAVIFFALNFLLTAVILGFVNGLVAVGEEVGWRGFLQPKLVTKFGLPLGIVLVGFLWAHWHTPLILQGYNYPETPVLGAFILWPVTCILFSFFLAWLVINGGSVWSAVLAHGSYNAFHGGLVDGMDFPQGRLTADFVVIGIWLVTAIIAFSLTKKKDPGGKPNNQPSQQGI